MSARVEAVLAGLALLLAACFGGVGAGTEPDAMNPQELEGYNPTTVYLRLARQHEKHASEHLSAARRLEEFEQGGCKAFAPEIRAVCPLLGQVDAVEDVPGGVRVWLSEGVDVDAAVAHMRCHLAFGRAHGRAGMESCPLYVPEVRVERVRQSRGVDLESSDPGPVDELRQRTRLHVVPRPVE